MPEKIVVAMSGGVDSSTAAALLKEQGFDVVGLSMQLWDYTRSHPAAGEEEQSRSSGTCCSLDDIYDARRVARFLGLPFYVVNFEDAFENQVIQPFVDSYLRGETPIPCIHCNTVMKFDLLLDRAAEIGAGKLATGHYARIRLNPETHRYELLRGLDVGKDQSFFLFEMTQDQLSRVLFPLGEYSKAAVRAMAEKYGLPVFEKPDSQEICFIPDKDYGKFVESYLAGKASRAPGQVGAGSPEPSRQPKAGHIVSRDGKILGEHTGVHRFTVGQRKGLGVAVGEPLYVLQTDVEHQRVVVGRDQDLLRKGLLATRLNWISMDRLTEPLRVKAKIRNRHEAAAATIFPEGGDSVSVEFDEPQRAVTPGQAAVFYNEDCVVGGGWIKESL